MSKVNDGGPAFPSNRDMRYGGMTLRQYAAIKLRVPNSGTDWLDEMILTSLRDDLAAKAVPLFGTRSLIAAYWRRVEKDERDLTFAQWVAKNAHGFADAMLAARGEKK